MLSRPSCAVKNRISAIACSTWHIIKVVWWYEVLPPNLLPCHTLVCSRQHAQQQHLGDLVAGIWSADHGSSWHGRPWTGPRQGSSLLHRHLQRQRQGIFHSYRRWSSSQGTSLGLSSSPASRPSPHSRDETWIWSEACPWMWEEGSRSPSAPATQWDSR